MIPKALDWQLAILPTPTSLSLKEVESGQKSKKLTTNLTLQ